SRGLLAKLPGICFDVLGIQARLLCVSRSTLRILESMGLAELFVLRGMPASPELPLRDITPNAGDEPDLELVRRQVLEAHKLLVTLNPRLLGDFVDLINCLEGDGAER